MKLKKRQPWAFLDDFRGKDFSGEWPTLPEMFSISAGRFPDRLCLTSFEPDRVSLTYREALSKIRDLAAWLASQEIGRAHV